MKEKEVIIAEKPNAAKKIAVAVSKALNGNLKTIRYKNKVPVHIITTNIKEVIVLPAVGHLFTLTTPLKRGYPVFDVEWKPNFLVNRDAYYTKDYYDALKEYGKGANRYIIATDFDIEGETIGYNILRHIFKVSNAERMKFSTLLIEDLIKAYQNKLPNMLHNTAISGITRHTLDFYYGINLSRGLMESISKVGKREVLSIGRVQGPTLGILVKREKEISSFTPTPYYTIEGTVEGNIKIKYIEEKIFEEKKANEIWSKVKDSKKGMVKEIKKTEKALKRPSPYNLTDLQTDAHSFYGLSPQKVLDIAQSLYEKALISYPRTSSQKYPSHLPIRKIAQSLSNLSLYREFINEILSGPLVPNNGKKDDEAHPAIYPTGDITALPTLTKEEKVIYDLIVRRFISTLHEDARRAAVKGIINIKRYDFLFEAHFTTYEGWLRIYKGLIKLDEDIAPSWKKGDIVKITQLKKTKKKTQPPKRYTPASLIRELEKRNLGTKSTRSMILETLYKREYIKGKKNIEVTPLGMKVYEIMEKYMPEILSEDLTRKFEEKLTKIEKGEINHKEVLEESKRILQEVCEKIKSKELEIGKELIKSNEESKKLGECIKCKGSLIIKTYKSKGKTKRFLSCSSYPECNEAYPLPQKGNIEPTTKKCDICSYPILKVNLPKKRSYEFCINASCENNFLKKFNNTKNQNGG